MKQIQNNSSFHCLRSSPFGPVAVLWSPYQGEPKVIRIILSKPEASAGQVLRSSFPDSASSSSPAIDALADQVASFLAGDDVRFSLNMVRIDLCSPFQQGVLRAEHAIPRGRVSTYRLIAGHLSSPNASRAVGTALATNPFPIVIPCHRAIRSDGTLGGYQGGLNMKRILLEREGVLFRDPYHVMTHEFYYSNNAPVDRRFLAFHNCSL